MEENCPRPLPKVTQWCHQGRAPVSLFKEMSSVCESFIKELFFPGTVGLSCGERREKGVSSAYEFVFK